MLARFAQRFRSSLAILLTLVATTFLVAPSCATATPAFAAQPAFTASPGGPPSPPASTIAFLAPIDFGGFALESLVPDARATRVQAVTTAMPVTLTPEQPMTEQAEPILQFFEYAHLPARLSFVSKPFHDLAHAIARGDNVAESGTVTIGPPLPRNAERTVALRKLLESKDAAVRAMLNDPDWTVPPSVSTTHGSGS